MTDDKFEGRTEVRPDARANMKPVPALDAAYVPPQVETASTLGTLRRRLRVLGTRHPRWRSGFQLRRGPLGIQRGYRVTAIDASGAEFGFGIYAGTDETAEQMAAELVALLRSVQGGDDGNA